MTASAMSVADPSDEDLEAIAASLAPFNKRVILTGAGFSKPWGGYLASELWSVIVSDPSIRGRTETDRILHSELNFEKVLARVQGDDHATVIHEDGEQVLWRAVMRAFEIMDRRVALDNVGEQLSSKLRRFFADLALTAANMTTFFLRLNLVRLIELFCVDSDPTRSSVVIPGVAKQLDDRSEVPLFDPATFRMTKDRVSYIKLHGSMNWRVGDSDVVVLGGAKTEAINRFPLLRMNNAIFRRALRERDTRLLVIGYGFADEHINEAIAQGIAARNGLTLWIADPKDPEVIWKTMMKHGLIWHSVVGHSRSAVDLFRPKTSDHELFHGRFWT